MTKRIGPHTAATADSADDDREGSGRVSSVEVRSWARKHGLVVSDRGRLSAEILTAWQSR